MRSELYIILHILPKYTTCTYVTEITTNMYFNSPISIHKLGCHNPYHIYYSNKAYPSWRRNHTQCCQVSNTDISHTTSDIYTGIIYQSCSLDLVTWSTTHKLTLALPVHKYMYLCIWYATTVIYIV